jgi:hypothetical protein
LIVSAVFAGGTDTVAYSSQSTDSFMTETLCDTVSSTALSTTDSALCLPRQVSFANTQQVQSSARRIGSTHRNNLEFARSGKVINTGIRYSVQNRSVMTHSRQSDPAALLLSLGRLII